MIANIQLHRDDLRRIIDSLHDPVRGEESTNPLDLNLIAKKPDSFELFTRQGDFLQLSHRIQDSESISVEVEENRKFVFTSKVLREIVRKARPEPLAIKFFDRKYAVRLSNEGTFSTPTSLDLHLVSNTEFIKPMGVTDLNKIASINRSALLESLETMGIVSKVVQLKITQDEFWISVSDKVEGEGKVMADTLPDCDINDAQFKYKLEPITKFMSNIASQKMNLYMNPDGVLSIEGKREGDTSTILVAPRTSDRR